MRWLGGAVDRYRHLWWISGFLAVLAAWWLNDTKQGVSFPDVALEFAGTKERAERVIDGFEIEMVRSTLVRDYVFLTFVFLGLAMLVAWASRQFRSGVWRDAGRPLMWASLVGGLLDIIEDTALLGFLGDWLGWAEYWPAIAAGAAGVKWIIVVVAAGYGLAGLVLAVLRFRPQNRTGAGRFRP